MFMGRYKKALIAASALVCVTPIQANADSYDAMFAATDWLARKYGVVVYTNHQPMEYGVYGLARGNTITFNSGYIGNPDLLRRDVTTDIMLGWHPGAHCSPEQYVAAHEFAHVLNYLTGYNANTELVMALSSGLTGEVSGYSLYEDGSVNYEEAIAEAFAAVECDVPSPAEHAIYVMLTT